MKCHVVLLLLKFILVYLKDENDKKIPNRGNLKSIVHVILFTFFVLLIETTILMGLTWAAQSLDAKNIIGVKLFRHIQPLRCIFLEGRTHLKISTTNTLQMTEIHVMHG